MTGGNSPSNEDEAKTEVPDNSNPLSSYSYNRSRQLPKGVLKKIVEAQEANLEGKTRIWETINKVLGHNSKSNANRPKALLSLSNIQDEKPTSTKAFESPIWSYRYCAERLFGSLLKVEELKYNFKMQADPSEKSNLQSELKGALNDLNESIGLRGLNENERELSQQNFIALENHLDIRLIANILQSAKGTKAVSRVLVHLQEEEKCAIIPSIMALSLARPSKSGHNLGPVRDLDKAEGVLMETLKDIFNQSESDLALMMFKRCLDLIMSTHKGKDTLKSALSNVDRSKALHALLLKGCEISAARGPETELEWIDIQSEFLEEAI